MNCLLCKEVTLYILCHRLYYNCKRYEADIKHADQNCQIGLQDTGCSKVNYKNGKASETLKMLCLSWKSSPT